jgi:hypothetical protein
VYEKEASKGDSLTSSEDTIDVWASKEALVSLAFFARLAFRA